MRRSPKLLLVLLTGLFWIAQVQGTVHGIAHLKSGAEIHNLAPQSVVCADCAAYSQAGAAPVVALKAPPAADPGVAPVEFSGRDRLESPRVLGFRSRAPPATSI